MQTGTSYGGYSRFIGETMDISIDLFDNYRMIEYGNQEFRYRSIAEDEVTSQYIDIDLEDDVTDAAIAELYHAMNVDLDKNIQVV